jgi:hypothetical protein
LYRKGALIIQLKVSNNNNIGGLDGCCGGEEDSGEVIGPS